VAARRATRASNAGAGSGLRPQLLLLSFLGDHVYGRGIYVFSGSIIDVLERAGVSEWATRSTLARMADRDLLLRRRRGRRVYYGLTPRTVRILKEGAVRLETGPVNREVNGSWTLLAFSMPESWQRERHSLRSRLSWAGFGPLQSGLWMAPSEVNVRPILEELGLETRVKVFSGSPRPPTDLEQLVRDAYDLKDLGARYASFSTRWGPGRPARAIPDALVRKLLLTAEWLQIIRLDPRLPLALLPRGWPAVRAERLFKGLNTRYHEAARRIARTTLEVIPAERQGSPRARR
jgi:phenylacetic acid degradation operon negative regulatory protein